MSYNLYAYCLNNPVNRFDDGGNLSLPNWAKVAFGIVNTVKSAVLPSSTDAKARPNSLPPKGVPGSNQTLPNPDGTPKQKRWYGPDGYLERDRDYNHPGNMPFPHDHVWNNGKRGREHLPPDPRYKTNYDHVNGIGVIVIYTLVIVVTLFDNVVRIKFNGGYRFRPLGTFVGKGLIMILK